VAALAKSKYPNDNAILLKRRILEGVEVMENLGNYVIGGGRLSAIGALTTKINITPPVLQEVVYKSKKAKLFVYGIGIKDDVTVVVGKSGFPGKPRSDDGTAFLAKVPESAFPAGVPVQIKLRNPDGGESSAIIFTR
jgi:hypothetical protein